MNKKLNYENAKLLADFSSSNANTEKLLQAQTELEVAKLKMENESSLLEKQKNYGHKRLGLKMN